MPNWSSQTRQFGDEEMPLIETLSAAELGPMIANSPPVVALRVLAELLLNGATEKLDALLAIREVNARWQQFQSDAGVDTRDEQYAQQLVARLTNLSSGS